MDIHSWPVEVFEAFAVHPEGWHEVSLSASLDNAKDDDEEYKARTGRGTRTYNSNHCYRELFKWAATVYTSRSFNPQTVRPEDGSKWTAYKHTADGPQAVLLDLNNYPDDWQTFSVLFPVMDAGNHNPNAKVDWAYDPGKFSLSIREGVSKGDEIFNNYGPKGNDELLMGYGFCAEDNPHDGILLSMKPPPQPLQSMLQMIHPHYFRPTGEWNSDAATFRLLRWQLHDTEDTSEFGAFTRAWAPIPEPLLELFCYIVQFERGVPVSPIDNPEDYLKRGYGQRYLPRIALYILMSMLPKIHKLEHSDAELPEEPQNSRQANAKIYRDCQMEVLDAVQERMAAYLKSLILEPSTDPIRRSATWTLEGALEVIQREAPDAHKAFMSGVKYCTGTTKLRKLRGTEQEEFMWTILLCFAYLHSQKTKAAADANKNGILSNWMRSLEAEYGSPLPEEGAEVEVDEVADEDAEEYLGRVKKAAMFLPGSIWTSPAWTGDFVLDWGVRLVKSQGTYMEVDEGDMRYVVYLHIGA